MSLVGEEMSLRLFLLPHSGRRGSHYVYRLAEDGPSIHEMSTVGVRLDLFRTMGHGTSFREAIDAKAITTIGSWWEKEERKAFLVSIYDEHLQ